MWVGSQSGSGSWRPRKSLRQNFSTMRTPSAAPYNIGVPSGFEEARSAGAQPAAPLSEYFGGDLMGDVDHCVGRWAEASAAYPDIDGDVVGHGQRRGLAAYRWCKRYAGGARTTALLHRPPIAGPCRWEDDEVDGGAVETLPHAEEADHVRTQYHHPGAALVH